MAISDFLAKVIVYASILLSLISGLVLVGSGAFLQFDNTSQIFLEANYLVIGLYITGGVLLLLALLGLIAASSRNCLVISLYICGLLVVLAAEAYLVYYVYTESESFVAFNLWETLNYDKREFLQDTFQCCGFNATFPKFSNSSCAYTVYCEDKISEKAGKLHDFGQIIVIVFIVLQFLNLIAMSFLAGRPRTSKHQQRAKEQVIVNRNQRILEEARHSSRR